MNAKVITFGNLEKGQKVGPVYRGIFLDVWSKELGLYPIVGYNRDDPAEWILHEPDFYTSGSGYVEVVYECWLPPNIFIPITHFERVLLRQKMEELDVTERLEFQRNSGILRRFLDKETPWHLRRIYDRIEGVKKGGWLF
jgi:hypothetical protein